MTVLRHCYPKGHPPSKTGSRLVSILCSTNRREVQVAQRTC